MSSRHTTSPFRIASSVIPSKGSFQPRLVCTIWISVPNPERGLTYVSRHSGDAGFVSTTS